MIIAKPVNVVKLVNVFQLTKDMNANAKKTILIVKLTWPCHALTTVPTSTVASTRSTMKLFSAVAVHFQ